MGDRRRATGNRAQADLQHIFCILRVHQYGPEVLERSGWLGVKSTSWYSNLLRRGAEKEDGAGGWTRWVGESWLRETADEMGHEEGCGRGLRARLAEEA